METRFWVTAAQHSIVIGSPSARKIRNDSHMSNEIACCRCCSTFPHSLGGERNGRFWCGMSRKRTPSHSPLPTTEPLGAGVVELRL